MLHVCVVKAILRQKKCAIRILSLLFFIFFLNSNHKREIYARYSMFCYVFYVLLLSSDTRRENTIASDRIVDRAHVSDHSCLISIQCTETTTPKSYGTPTRYCKVSHQHKHNHIDYIQLYPFNIDKYIHRK